MPIHKIKGEFRFQKKEGKGETNDPSDYEVTLERKFVTLSQVIQKHNKANKDSFFVEVEFKPKRRQKTRAQLGYLFAAIFPKFQDFYFEYMAESVTIEKVKEDLKHRLEFLEEEYNPLTDEHLLRAKSLASSTVEECSLFISKLVRLAAEFGILIESPEAYKLRKGITPEQWTGKAK